MPVNQKAIQRLNSQLLTSGLSQKDQPLFQVVKQLIDFVNDLGLDVAALTGTGSGSGGGGGGGGLANQDYVTHRNNLGNLPNSRILLAGAGTTIHKTPSSIVLAGAPFPPERNFDFYEPLIIPGPTGPRGLTGPQGIPGLDAYNEENNDRDLSPWQMLNLLLPWTSVPIGSLSFSTSSAAVWTVPSIAYFKYAKLGNIIFMKMASLGQSVSAATATELRISLTGIGGITLVGNDSFGFTVYSETGFGVGGQDTGQSILRVSNNSLVFKTRTGANWAVSAAQTGVITNLIGEI